MKNFILTLWLAMSLAACPNNCNGHGQCKSGTCVCNKQTGLGLGLGAENYHSYTGADCSMRTCPLGFPFGYISPILESSQTILYGGSYARSLESIEYDISDVKVPSPYKYDVYSVKGADWIEDLEPEGGQLYCKDTRTGVSNPYSGSATVYYVNNGEAIVQYSFKVANESSVVNSTTTEEDGTPQESARRLEEAVPLGGGGDNDDSTTDEDGTVEVTTTIPPTSTTPPVTPAPVKNPTPPPTPAELSCRVTAKSNDLSMRMIGKSVKDNQNQIRLLNSASLLEEMGFPTDNSIDGKKLEFACYSKKADAVAVSGYPVFNPQITKVEKETGDEENIIFTIKDSPLPTDESAYCYLLSKANGTAVKIEDSDVAKTLFIQEGDLWFYPASASGNTEAIPNEEDGTVKLIVSETVSKNIINYFIYGIENKEENKNYTISAEKRFIVPLPNDENKGTVKAQVYPGAMITITVIYTIKQSGGELGPFTYTTQSQIIAADDFSADFIKGILIKSYPEFELAEIFEPNSADFRRMRVLADGDGFNIDNIIVETENCVETKDPDPPKRELCPHKAVECSGAGICDRISGQCQCYNGYSGDACQRMDCPNDCNNNGRCVLLTELLKQTNKLEYKGYGAADKVYGCLCDPGRRGPDCSLLECPSAEDPLGGTNKKNSGDKTPDLSVEHRDCSGRGICDFKTGTCTCFDGYYGEACQIRASTN